MIAVDMLRHSFRKNMDKATLLTGDLDFKHLLDALVLEGMYTTLWYDPRITSKELLYAADSNQVIHLSYIYSHSTDSFKAKHPAPQISSGGYEGQIREHFKNQIASGNLNSSKINLYSNDSKDGFFMLYYADRVGYRFANFDNQEYLTRWFEYEYNGKIIWEKKA